MTTELRQKSENPNEPRRLRSEELFAGASKVFIEHNGAEYRLQVTQHGKLILTK